MNRYQLITRKREEFSAKDINNAKVLDNFESILNANQVSGEYIFNADEKATAFFRKATSVVREPNFNKDGDFINNRLKVVVNDRNFLVRCYGIKEELPSKTYTKEEIAALDFGYCKVDGEIKTETKSNGDGLVRVPVFYAKIS